MIVNLLNDEGNVSDAVTTENFPSVIPEILIYKSTLYYIKTRGVGEVAYKPHAVVPYVLTGTEWAKQTRTELVSPDGSKSVTVVAPTATK